MLWDRAIHLHNTGHLDTALSPHYTWLPEQAAGWVLKIDILAVRGVLNPEVQDLAFGGFLPF